MAPILSIVPISPNASEAVQPSEHIVTARRLAPYVLAALVESQLAGTRCDLNGLAERFPVRRADLRRTLSALHANDLYDALRGRLTLAGFALGLKFRNELTVPIREAIRHDGRPCGEVLAGPVKVKRVRRIAS